MFSRGSLNGEMLNGPAELNGGAYVHEGPAASQIQVIGAYIRKRWEIAGTALISLVLSSGSFRRLGRAAGRRTMMVDQEYRTSHVAPENRVMIVTRRKDEQSVDPRRNP